MSFSLVNSFSDLAQVYGYARNCFYAQGRFWLFYGRTTGNKLYYISSADGSTWTTPVQILEIGGGNGTFSVADDGTVVHICWASGTAIYYARGTLGSDGTITWDSDPFDITGTLDNAAYPSIALDSEGYPWIGFQNTAGGNTTSYVTASSTKDGTWTNIAGFPYQLDATDNDWSLAAPISLPDQNVAIIYSRHEATFKCKIYTPGVGWSSEENATSLPANATYWSVVGDSKGNIYLAFMYLSEDETYSGQLVRRNILTGVWSAEINLSGETANNDLVPKLSVDLDSNDIYAQWYVSDILYLSIYVAAISVWLDPTSFSTGATLSFCNWASRQKNAQYICRYYNTSAHELYFGTLAILPQSVSSPPHGGL